MSIGGKCVPVWADGNCPSTGIPEPGCEMWPVPLLLPSSLTAGGREYYAEVLAVPALCVYYGCALGLRNSNRRTCDDLKNHAPMLSTLQPA